MKFTIDVVKENVEPISLFFHSWEHDGKKIDADPRIVQKLAIAVRKAIRSVLFVPVVNTVGEIKEELQKREAKSKTKVNIEMTLNDAMHILGAFCPDSQNKEALKEKGEAAIMKMAGEIDKILEGLDNTAKNNSR